MECSRFFPCLSSKWQTGESSIIVVRLLPAIWRQGQSASTYHRYTGLCLQKLWNNELFFFPLRWRSPMTKLRYLISIPLFGNPLRNERNAMHYEEEMKGTASQYTMSYPNVFHSCQLTSKNKIKEQLYFDFRRMAFARNQIETSLSISAVHQT